MPRSAPMLAVLLLTAALAAPVPALAQSKHPEMDKCFEQPEADNGVTAAMLDCTNARMHAALAKLIAQNPKKATQLKREQAQWQQKMKRAAKKEYTRTGGTMDLLNGSGLVLDMTEKRADALEKRLAR